MRKSDAMPSLLLGRMRWSGDGLERNHDLAASVWYIAAQHANQSAPALLAKYHFVACIVADKRQIRVERDYRPMSSTSLRN